MKRNQTSNFVKALNWIVAAMKREASVYFRFVVYTTKYEYSDWMTPEAARKEIRRRDESNTLRIEKVTFER